MSTLPALSRPWLELLESLCNIDSRTAEGCAGTIDVAQILGQELDRLGFELSWHDPLPEEGPRGRHLIATRHPDASKRLVLVGHTDVILSPQEVPFSIDPVRQRVHGSGVCDMKGPDVLMIHALADALHRHEHVKDAGLVVMFNCAEETSSASFMKLVERWQSQTLACLGFEPGRYNTAGQDSFVSARKGVATYHITCEGRASHAGTHHPHGINAVVEAARIALAVHGLTDYAKDLTANVGMLQGGRVHNQIPDVAHMICELRAFDPQVFNTACQQVQTILANPSLRSAMDNEPVRIRFKQEPGYPAWKADPRHDELAQRYIRLLAKHGIEASHHPSGGASDASRFAPHMPTIDGLGMLGGGAHSTSEWADIASYEPRAHAAADLIAELVG